MLGVTGLLAGSDRSAVQEDIPLVLGDKVRMGDERGAEADVRGCPVRKRWLRAGSPNWEGGRWVLCWIRVT
jgi:hypothetical protein